MFIPFFTVPGFASSSSELDSSELDFSFLADAFLAGVAKMTPGVKITNQRKSKLSKSQLSWWSWGRSEPLSRGFRGWSSLRKFLGSK